MIKIAICEDCLTDCECLEKQLNQTGMFKTANYSYYKNGKELNDAIDNGAYYDFVFLDVDMPIVNGIEAGKHICSASPKTIIIFVTAYPQYAIDAFDCNAFHYILKNSDFDKFCSVIHKALERHKMNHRTYCISCKEGVWNIPVSDIYYIELCRKKLIFHTADNQYVSTGTLSKALSDLEDLGFFQCHQGYIVNFSKVFCIQKYDIVLDNSSTVMMSVRKRPEFLKEYNNYLRRCFV